MSLEEITPLETNAWTTYRIINKPAERVLIEVVERPFPEPEEARKVRERCFLKLLEKTKKKLEVKGKECFIGDYNDIPDGGISSALFMKLDDGEKTINFDGETANFNGDIKDDDENVVIGIYTIAYSEWVACGDPEYAKAYEEKHGWIPHAGIGISIAVESSDGFFVLTQRGTGTTNYPGALFTVGGGLKPTTSILSGLEEEIAEELGIKAKKHYNPDEMIITALGAEKSYKRSRHPRAEIVGYLKTDATWEQIAKMQKETKYQADVAGIVPIAEPLEFFSKISMTSYKSRLLPAAELGLVYAFLKKIEKEYGHEELEHQAANLRKILNR